MMIGASQHFPDIGKAYYEAGPKQMVEALAQWMVREERLGRLDTGGDSTMAAEHFLSLVAGQIETRGLLGQWVEMPPAEMEKRARYCADIFMRAFGPHRLMG
jgi:hypothetical protein